jgi:peroxiredoxin
VQPALKNWYQNYHSQGLEIVAIHSPEFDYEKKLENVQQAVKEQGLKYPVALDNDFKTWNKYRVRAWPSLFLVDKQGQIRYSHVGEGNYELTEAAIKALLDENG